MTTADAPSAPLLRANPIARLTDALFGWLPISLALLALPVLRQPHLPPW